LQRQGISLATQGINLNCETEADEHVQNQLLEGSLQNLEKAFSYAQGRRRPEEALKIRLAQAFVARAMNANGAVKMYLHGYWITIQKEITATKATVEQLRPKVLSYENEIPEEKRGKYESAVEHILANLGPVKTEADLHPNHLNRDHRYYELSAAGRRRTEMRIKTGVSPILFDMRIRLGIAEHRLARLEAFQRFWEL